MTRQEALDEINKTIKEREKIIEDMKGIFNKVEDGEKSEELKNTLDSMVQIHQNTNDDLQKITSLLRN